MPVYLECSAVIDSGQSIGVRSVKGSGIASITKIATGQYKVQLEDAYNRYLGGMSGFVSPVTGNINATSMSAGTTYIIRTLGTTTQAMWEAAGLPKGVTALPGVAFSASAAAAASTGTVSTASASGIDHVEVVGDPNLTIGNPTNPYFIIQTLASGVATAPADGSVMGLTILLRNSSNKGKGE